MDGFRWKTLQKEVLELWIDFWALCCNSVMDDQGGSIQIVVTPNCPIVQDSLLVLGGLASQENINAQFNAESLPCLLEQPTTTAAASADCSRSIISNASSCNISYQQRQRRAQWRGIGSTCMWNAFRASFFGLLLLVSGCIVVLVGTFSPIFCLTCWLVIIHFAIELFRI